MSIEWNKKEEEFYNLCDMFNLTYPDVQKADNEDYTSHFLIKFGENTDIPHLFGHFLADYHVMEPDRVADIVADLVKEKITEKTTKYNMGLYK